jgi:hypothetical protein
MGELELAATQQAIALANSARRNSIQQRVEQETEAANQEYSLKLAAMARDSIALDTTAKDYQNKLKAINNQEEQLAKEHENKLTDIKNKAEMERNASILSAEQRATDQIATGLTQSIMGHESWSRMVTSFAGQAAEGMIRNSLLIMMQQDREKLSTARSAAATAYANGEKYGGPAGFILGPVFAAAAFAGVMAFQSGTDRVPGLGTGDTVPAMLAPGEGVVPGGVMDNLRKMAASGSMGGGTTVHLHHSPTYHVQTIDGDGIRGVLTEHSDEFARHMQGEIRKMNR